MPIRTPTIDRRQVLQRLGLGLAGVMLSRCVQTPSEDEVTDGDGGRSVPDTASLDASVAWDEGVADGHADVWLVDSGVERDAGPDARPSPDAFYIEQQIEVILSDNTCSGHEHGVYIAPGWYAPDDEMFYSGGSHEVMLTGAEIARVLAGEGVPYSTIGEGPSHGHCGLVWWRAQAPDSTLARDPITDAPQCVLPVNTLGCPLRPRR